MRKLIFGLLAVTIVFLMGSPASAQETPSEDPTEQYPVECTMRNLTPPEWRNENGSYPAGTPITLELNVPNGGEMDWFFVASLNGGDEYRLNDESLMTIGWTPIDPGTYTVHGEFIDENGNVLEVENPASCMVTLAVEAAQPEPPTPPTTVEEEVPVLDSPDVVFTSCGPPETLTYVWDEANQWFDVYNADNKLCAHVAAETAAQIERLGSEVVSTPAPASPRAELPRTGNGTMALAFVALGLVPAGLLFCIAAKKRFANG